MKDSDIMRELLNEMSFKEKIELDEKYALRNHTLVLENERPNQMVFEDVVLEEGLIRSYPVDKTLAYLNRCIQTPLIQASVVRCGNGVQGIQVSYPEYADNKEVITDILNSCGFYYSYDKDTYTETFGTHEIVFHIALFEPKFNEEVDGLRNEEKVLYHITHTSNEQRILKQGFTPRDNGSEMTYPPRIFFGRGSDGKQKALYMGVNLYTKRIGRYNKEDSQRNNKDSRRNDQYTLFTVDVAKMPNNIRFYGDPGSYTGVWTNDNVPPNCIVDVEHYEFEYDKSDGGVKIINRK